MERKERIAWVRPPEEEPPEHLVALSLTVDEVEDLQRALGIYRDNSLIVARKRPLSHDELQASATVNKVQGQMEGWRPPVPNGAKLNGQVRPVKAKI